MANNTLKDKIKRVLWWALGLTVLYFLLGVCLLSDGSKFDPNKTYNLLKDTLTLTASFLAPTAAFVLFSDWRLQHIETKNEKLSEDIYSVMNKFFNFLNMNPKFNDDQKLHDLRSEFYKNITNLEKLILQVNHGVAGAEHYIRQVKKLITLLRQFELRFIQLNYFHGLINLEQGGDSSNNNVVLESYIELSNRLEQEKGKIFLDFYNIYNELKMLKVNT